MTAEFTDVVNALTQPPNPASVPGVPERVTVLGAGMTGRALAAWLVAEGTPTVTLFSVYADELAALSAGSVTLRGDGPVGTFRTGDGGIRVTSVLDAAVADSDVLFVTGPVFKLRTYGMVLAPYLAEDQALVVCPAQTFGALEVDWWLAAGGHRHTSPVVELSRAPFGVEASDGTLVLKRRSAAAAARPAHRTGLIDWLAGMFGELAPAPTVLHSSFGDGSGLVDVPALVLGGPAAADDGPGMLPGAVALAPPSLRRLITPRVAEMVGRLADERRAVASRYGVLDLPTDDEWIDLYAGGDAPADALPVPGPAEAETRVRQGVLGSLVPLMSAAGLAGVAVPATHALVQTVSTMLGTDLAAAGRRLDGLGFSGAGPDEIRRSVGVTGAAGGR